MNIKFDKRNYRKHSDRNKELIKKSLKELGTGRSIIIDANNEIIGGNGVFEQAQKLNIPVKIIETDGSELIAVKRTDLKNNDEKRKQLAIMDNSTSDSSEWELDLLQSDFKVDTLNDWGIDLDFPTLEPETEIIEDEVPEKVETRAKFGDIWQLGNHRLMCGDSTSVTDVEKLMNGKKADMVFTDPPYGMKKEAVGVLNDNLNFDDLLEFNRQWIPVSFNAAKENGSWYCWGIDEPLMDIYSNILKPMIKERKITFRNLITWDKNKGQGQMSSRFKMFPVADEKCLFVVKGMAAMSSGQFDTKEFFFKGFAKIRDYLVAELKKSGLTKKNIIEATSTYASHYFSMSQWAFPTEKDYLKIQELTNGNAFRKEYSELLKEYSETLTYFDNTHDNMNNVWHFERTSTQERELTGGHATPKPIALCSRAIKSSSREGESVLDLFGGSGSTLIACEQFNRQCYMIELDPHYCDVIITRWETLTGGKAVLING